MEYRNFDADYCLSLLGFGAMRLPLNAEGGVDRAATRLMVERALAGGVNYFDTAYGYHGGESEVALGEALSGQARSNYFLADKMPVWELNENKSAPQIFEEQLKKCRVDYFDFYLLHSVTQENYDKARALGVVDYLLEEKKRGRIRRLGFSFHDRYALFAEVLQAWPWDFCQIQFNYMDVDYQAGEKGLKLAGRLGIPVFVMEPLKGGRLAQLPAGLTAGLTEGLKEGLGGTDFDAPALAFRFLAAYPEVKLILSGMSNLEQIEDNLRIFSAARALSPGEQAALETLRLALLRRQRSACTACGYCMPCPFGVGIPENFAAWNEFALYGRYEDSIEPYFSKRWDDERADRCTGCGRCETLCPQHLPIAADLARLHEEFLSKRK